MSWLKKYLGTSLLAGTMLAGGADVFAQCAIVGGVDSYSTNEDTQLNVGVPLGVYNNDSGYTSGYLVQNPVKGTLVFNDADGSFVYTPHDNLTGSDSFVYRLTDGTCYIDVPVTLYINKDNLPPVAVTEHYIVNEDEPFYAAAPGVLGNDIDPDGDSPLLASLVNHPVHGTITLNSDGSFVYTPYPEYSGADRFTYQVSDIYGPGSTVVVTLYVRPLNDAPVAVDDYYEVEEGSTLVVPISIGLAYNDSDVDNTTVSLNYSLTNLPSHGTVTVFNPDGSFEYTPNPDFFGTDTFEYTVSDPDGAQDTATVTIVVTPTNDAPIATPHSYIVPSNGVLTINAPGVLGDDYDVDGDPLTAGQDSTPAHGSLSFNSDGSFTYTLTNTGYVGTDVFTYYANDGTTNSVVTTVTLNIGHTPDMPNARDDVYPNASKNTTFSVPATNGLLGNDFHGDGVTPVTVVPIAIVPPSNGVLTLNPDGSFDYEPNPGFVGTDSFQYIITDGTNYSAPATVTLTVLDANEAPVANGEYYMMNQDSTLTISAPGLLANDWDPDGDTLSISLVPLPDPTVGNFLLNPDGSFTFTPAPGLNTPDFGSTIQVEYLVHDTASNSTTATVEIYVAPLGVVYQPPVANDDVYTINEDTMYANNIGSSLLVNDEWHDKGVIGTSYMPLPFVILNDDVDHGVLNLDPITGIFEYTPNADFHGTDFFTYELLTIDINTSIIYVSNIATVTFTVLPVNDPPVATPHTFTVPASGTLTINAPGVLGDDYDADGDPLTAGLHQNPTHGGLIFNADGSFTYTLSTPGFVGTDYFLYYANDGTTNSLVTTVTLAIGHLPNVPQAVDDYITTAVENTQLVITAPGILGNDYHPAGDPIWVVTTPASLPTKGTVNIQADGSMTYDPFPGEFGTDTFTYIITDGTNFSQPATVTIIIQEVNDPPVVNADYYMMAQDETLVVAAPGVLGNDWDPEGGALTASLVPLTDPTVGNLVLNPDGSFTFTPRAGLNSNNNSGNVIAEYVAYDGAGNGTTSTLEIYVAPKPAEPPVANDDLYTINEDTTFTQSFGSSILVNDIWPDKGVAPGIPLPEIFINDPTDFGLLTIDSSTGVFEYVPNPNFHGTDFFSYELLVYDPVSSTYLVSNIATVTFTVLPVNDAPVAVPHTFVVPSTGELVVNAPGALAGAYDIDGDPLTAGQLSSPAKGNLVFNADGSFTYTLTDPGFIGVDSFLFYANDGTTHSAATTISLVVGYSPDFPQAVNDIYSTGTENTPVIIDAPGLLANDFHPNGDPISVVIVPTAPPTNGVLTLAADGSFEYVPNPGFNGTDSFQYKIVDSYGVFSNSATVTIVIGAVDDAPIANNDYYMIGQDETLTVPAPGVLGNDWDPEGEPLHASLVPLTDPSVGVIQLNNDGSFTYTPTEGFNSGTYGGNVSFEYVAYDPAGNGTTATVEIYVAPKSIEPPVAEDDAYTLNEDEVFLNNVGASILINDLWPGKGLPPHIQLPLVYVNDNVDHGVLVIDNTTGIFEYTPNPDFHGTDFFTYELLVHDPVRDEYFVSNIATVTFTVLPVNDAPIAYPDFHTTPEDSPLTVAATGVLSNDVDADGDTLTAILQDNPANGSVALNGNGGFVYTPNLNYNGTDFFTYYADDGTSTSNITTVTIVVTPVPDNPFAVADAYNTNEDTILTVAAPGVLGNDIDVDGLGLSAELGLDATYGTVTLALDGSFTYEPLANYNGPDFFTYRVGSGGLYSDYVTVSLTVIPVQDVPVANPDAYTTPENNVLVINSPGVLANDVDLDGDPLTAIIQDNALNGVASVQPDGGFTYTPNPAFNGPDFFTYYVSDGINVSNVTTVTITVGAVNDDPVANPDIYNLFEDVTLTIPDPGVLQNDFDIDGDPLTVLPIQDVLYGNLTLNPTGGFTYVPLADFNGTDYFTYQVTDGLSNSNVVTVTLNVLPVQDAPIGNADFFETTEELELVVPAPGVLGNDVDADGEQLFSVIHHNPLNGVVLLDDDGSFIYTPNLGFSGTDTFLYRVHDGVEYSDLTTVTITVLPRNDRPIGFDDQYFTDENVTLNVPASNGVLANDIDYDGDPLTAVIINQPLHGSVVLNSDGSFAYTPNTYYRGPDHFTYRAFDGTLYSNLVTVNIEVEPVQEAPVGVADIYSVPEDKVLTVVAPGVLGNDSDRDGDPLTAFLVDHPANGVISLNADGSFEYTPDLNFFGVDLFTYYANDGTENSNLTTVTILVGGRNDGPVAVNDHYITPEDVPLNIAAPGVLGNDTDDDGDVLTAQLITPPLNGTLTLNPDGSFLYTPNLHFNGVDSFVYRANDGTVLSNPATVTIEVTSINDAPVLSNVLVNGATSASILENGSVILTADLYDADPTDTFNVIVNWGDGSVPQVLNYPAGTSKLVLSHQYLDDNPTATPFDVNIVTLTVQDNNGGGDVSNSNVTVNNVAPNFLNVSLTHVIPTGGTARLQGTIQDVGTLDTFVLDVDWGDGSVDTFNHGPGASPFDYLHTYATPGVYTVTVTVTDDDGGVTIITPTVDVKNTANLSLIKNANPDPAAVGELITYTMIVTNHGPDVAHNVILMDTLPTNVEFTSSTPAAPWMVPADGVYNWFLGDIGIGQTIRVDLQVRATQQGPVTNWAKVISDDLDPDQANNEASVTVTVGWLPDGPDLKAEAVRVNTVCKMTKKGPRCTLQLWALVANRGNERANSSIYSVYLSDDAIFSPHLDMKLKTKRFKSLNPGEVHAQNQKIKTPAGYTTTGKFMIIVIDEGNLVFEGDETNNLVIYGPLP